MRGAGNADIPSNNSCLGTSSTRETECLPPFCVTDFVNTAARLAAAAAKSGGDILCSDAVHMHAPKEQLRLHQLTLQPAGSIHLKGKDGLTNVYRPQSIETASGIVPLRELRALIGRKHEMDLLRGAVAPTSDDRGAPARPTVVILEGEDGIGKSAVLDALLQEAPAGSHWTRLQAAAHLNVPFMACRNILCHVLELQGEVDANRMSWLLVCSTGATDRRVI